MSRLIFGSCNSQHYAKQPLWPVIQRRNASAFIWGGDAVYADDRYVKKGFLSTERLTATPEYLEQLYNDQLRHPDYRTLLATNISIFGTFDDHDYGVNNGDRTFEWRTESGIEFVKFLQFSEDSAMYQRASQGKGVYGVQVYDFSRPKGQHLMTDDEALLDPDVVPVLDNDERSYSGDQAVAVFVLDIRSNKSPWIDTYPERFDTDTEGDFLGEEQWNWFETAIGRSTAAVNIVVNGLQVHPERFVDASAVESWSGFPRSQHRLYQALLQENVRAPILITGDVHQAEMMRKDCRRQAKENEPQPSIRPIYEITTSGMTHSWGTRICGLANKPLCDSLYFNSIFFPLAHLAHWISPWHELLLDETTGERQYSLDLNVAELGFDWDQRQVNVRILGVEDRILLQQDWSFDSLTNVPLGQTKVTDADFGEVKEKLVETSIFSPAEDEEDWVCVHYRGIPNQHWFVVTVWLPIALLFVLATLPFWIVCFAIRRVFVSLSRANLRVHRQTTKKVD